MLSQYLLIDECAQFSDWSGRELTFTEHVPSTVLRPLHVFPHVVPMTHTGHR